MRNIDDPCYRNGSDVNSKQQKNRYLRLLHHSRWAWNGFSLQELIYAKWLVFKQAKKSLIKSRQTDPRVSAFDSLDIMSIRSLYCTLKTFNSTEDCFKTTLSNHVYHDLALIPVPYWKGLTIAVLKMEKSSITKEERGRLSTGGPVISISRYAKEVIYSNFRKADGQRRHRPWPWKCNTSGVMSTT